VVAEVGRLRRQRYTGQQIAAELRVSPATVSRILRRPTNGKAERFIQTALRERAYAKAYQRSDHRGAETPLWLHRYNWHRPHGSIGAKPPISRLGLTGNTLLRLHI
jgi:transposase InsO family protein